MPNRIGAFILFSSLLMAARPAVAIEGPNASAPVSVQGKVLDATMSPIAGARVVANGDGQTVPAPATVTDGRGEFTLALSPGTYTLKVDADGFEEILRSLEIGAAGVRAQEFVLQVAGVREAVTVSAPASYQAPAIRTATKTPTALVDVPQSITVVTEELMKDQLMTSIGQVVQYIPGISSHQGENNRDQIIVRGNSSSADFYVNGVRDDVQYYRDVYNLERVEALKGPNAMIFGRGGGGGVINRVTKEARFQRLHEASFQAGSFGNRRVTADVDQPIGDKVAMRLNGMYENSDSFRSFVGLERYGVTPTVTISPGERTKVTIRYEYLHDGRVADRGITSFQGSPADVDVSTYYGNPNDSRVRADVNLASATVEQRLGGATLRNQTLVAVYDRFYQNYVPGAATADMKQVALTAYNNATDRLNIFNQTDLTYAAATGSIRHTFLTGAEVGRQLTDNFRNTGFFNDTGTSILVPFDNPLTKVPVTFRQSATDADNHLRTNLLAAYAQDQVEVTRHLQLLGGLRFDRFDLQYHNNRNGDALDRVDNLVSPRAGVVVKAAPAVSVYSSYSVSYLPSSGDQFSSLTVVTEQVEPEKFTNYEAGAKWDLPAGLSFTSAVYRLDRTNTRSTDPNDPTRIVQTGSQRTTGAEVGLNGHVTRRWQMAGGYSHQQARVTSATVSAPEGSRVGQVPHHTLSLWNNYELHPRVSAAVGVVYRSDMFATIDDSVTLPGYVRADVALFVPVARQLRLQVNVENVFDKRYFVNADSNTNISPGSPRAVRVGLTTTF